MRLVLTVIKHNKLDDCYLRIYMMLKNYYLSRGPTFHIENVFFLLWGYFGKEGLAVILRF